MQHLAGTCHPAPATRPLDMQHHALSCRCGDFVCRSNTFGILELGTDGRYVHVLGATEGKLPKTPGCDGLSIDLAALWRNIDRLGPDDPSRS